MTDQKKDCRTCTHTNDVYFCKHILNTEVKQWSDRNSGVQYDEIIEPCPGWEEHKGG